MSKKEDQVQQLEYFIVHNKQRKCAINQDLLLERAFDSLIKLLKACRAQNAGDINDANIFKHHRFHNYSCSYGLPFDFYSVFSFISCDDLEFVVRQFLVSRAKLPFLFPTEESSLELEPVTSSSGCRVSDYHVTENVHSIQSLHGENSANNNYSQFI